MMKLVSEVWREYAKPTSKLKQRYGMYECPECLEIYKQCVLKKKPPRCRFCSDKLRVTHGDTGTRLHAKWIAMRQRCNNPTHPRSADYGGRGIKVCPTWDNDYMAFKTWCLENGYSEGSEYTLDRRDNNKGYSPDNCRFTTREVQARNTRRIYANNKSGYRGVSWNTRDKKFTAAIGVNNKIKELGRRYCAKEAAHLYDDYVKEHGLEHTLNFPDA